jgi:hypothetical protein
MATQTIQEIAVRDQALFALEQACDALAAARTQDEYLALIESGKAPLLEALDNARREARRILRGEHNR